MGKNERRRTERHPAESGNVTVQIVGVDTPITMVNVGVGGFATASDRLMPAGARLEARFTDGGTTWTTSLAVRIAYSVSHPCTEGEYRGKYITGFAFVDTDVPAVRRRIQDFLGRMMLQPVGA